MNTVPLHMSSNAMVCYSQAVTTIKIPSKFRKYCSECFVYLPYSSCRSTVEANKEENQKYSLLIWKTCYPYDHSLAKLTDDTI